MLFTSIEPLDAWRERLGLTAVLRPTVEQCKQVFSEMDVFGREANKAAKAALAAELAALTEGRK